MGKQLSPQNPCRLTQIFVGHCICLFEELILYRQWRGTVCILEYYIVLHCIMQYHIMLQVHFIILLYKPHTRFVFSDPSEQTFCKISSQEAQIFLKRGAEWNLQPNTHTSETISAIPTRWLSRGKITSAAFHAGLAGL